MKQESSFRTRLCYFCPHQIPRRHIPLTATICWWKQSEAGLGYYRKIYLASSGVLPVSGSALQGASRLIIELLLLLHSSSHPDSRGTGDETSASIGRKKVRRLQETDSALRYIHTCCSISLVPNYFHYRSLLRPANRAFAHSATHPVHLSPGWNIFYHQILSSNRLPVTHLP